MFAKCSKGKLLLSVSLIFTIKPIFALDPAYQAPTGTNLVVDNKTITTIADTSVSGGGVIVGDPRLGNNLGNVTLTLTNSIVDLNQNSVSHAVRTGSYSTGAILTTSISNSTIKLVSTGSNPANTIGVISESHSSGQSHLLNLEDVNIDVTGTGTNFSTGILAYSTNGAATIDIQLFGVNSIKATGSSNYVAAIDAGFNGGSDNITIQEHDAGGQIIAVSNGNATSYAINANTGGGGSIIINTQSEIIATSTAGSAYGISAIGDVVEVENLGSITAEGVNSYGIFSTATSTATLNIKSNIMAQGSNTSYAIYSQAGLGDNNINIAEGIYVHGGDRVGAAVYMTSALGNQVLNNNGIISATNDQAIFGRSTSGSTTINNNNLITGYVELSGNTVTFNNNGLFDLQDFSSGTKGSSVSSFGTNGTFNNAGVLALSEKNNTGTTSHATLTGLVNFNHNGIIDLRTGQNNLAGNTLTIGDGLGNGNFVSNGGSLYINTNIVATAGVSDKLILDNVVTGANGATRVFITPTAGSSYGFLAGDGIEVVQVNGNSSSNAFALGRPLVNGIYQYGLYQGGAANAYSWYLRNMPNAFNPIVGAYLANQVAATEMFNQQLRDRLLASSSDVAADTSQLNSLWLRTKMTHGSRHSIHDSISNRDRMYIMQLGGDLGVWRLNEGNLHVGVMAGYGDYKNTSTSRATRIKADSTVKGYNVGAYASWFQNDDSALGLYVDTWTQYGWFRNETKGKEVSGNKKYNSNVWSNSLEVGYGVVLGQQHTTQWIATPQAQLTYHYYDTDNLYDRHNELWVTDNKGSGLMSRVGVRLHGRDVERKQAIEPFVEVNWINNTTKNQLEFNGTELRDGMPKNRFEAKLGLQGNITNRFNVSAQVGGQWGRNKFDQYQGQLNVNYRF
ncbi:autotransporter family protein [Entomomonas asaccharolytica]|uniref:Autotransporter outer membrane beta-barrel domain-containing protein n=1 Tax=Entomomonas asaccharolytica TaxID=2785331 RepID=A0A974NGE1_9GAMM|nr:autotransporter outer membrane beta-barrel domain-containing protein [Entomomonas asaccharolytica]QQP86295.1 autotransporter outer membrane beta-barrel domain-containing protein [Entomomonas asaccharolytica]